MSTPKALSRPENIIWVTVTVLLCISTIVTVILPLIILHNIENQPLRKKVDGDWSDAFVVMYSASALIVGRGVLAANIVAVIVYAVRRQLRGWAVVAAVLAIITFTLTILFVLQRYIP